MNKNGLVKICVVVTCLLTGPLGNANLSWALGGDDACAPVTCTVPQVSGRCDLANLAGQQAFIDVDDILAMLEEFRVPATAGSVKSRADINVTCSNGQIGDGVLSYADVETMLACYSQEGATAPIGNASAASLDRLVSLSDDFEKKIELIQADLQSKIAAKTVELQSVNEENSRLQMVAARSQRIANNQRRLLRACRRDR